MATAQARQELTVADVHAGSARLAWVLLGIMALVVLSFVSVFFLAIERGRITGRDIDGIVTNALPSVEELTDARGDLRRLDTLARDSADSVGTGEPRPSAEAAAGLRRELDESLGAYFQLPMFPGEHELSAAVGGELAELAHALVSVQEAVAASDAERSRRAKRAEMRAAERLDDTLQRLVDLNATQGQELGLSIEANRAETRRLALSLDALAAALGLLATGVAVVAMRRTFRTLEVDRDGGPARVRLWAAVRRARPVRREDGARRPQPAQQREPLAGVPAPPHHRRREDRDDGRVARWRACSAFAASSTACSSSPAREPAPSPALSADLRAVVEDVIEGAQPEAVEHRIHLVAEPFATCNMACSPGVLTSLCSNLVYNAIRHMDDACERTVTVRVKAHEGHCRVEIDDTGPGVPPEIEGTLFNPFVRAHGHEPGVGLGLATVRRLAQGHGGEAGFRPKPSGGSVFWFELAVASEAGAPPP